MALPGDCWLRTHWMKENKIENLRFAARHAGQIWGKDPIVRLD